MNLYSIAQAFANKHDRMFLVKLRNVDSEYSPGEGGELFTVVSIRRAGLDFELIDAVFKPTYGVDSEVVFMYPLASIEALARHMMGDKAVEMMKEARDDIANSKGTRDRDCPKGKG